MAEGKPKKNYNFTVVEFNSKTKKWESDGEIWTGEGATPEEAAKASVDEYDLSPHSVQTVFYFTMDIRRDRQETGFIRLARTGLVVERIKE